MSTTQYRAWVVFSAAQLRANRLEQTAYWNADDEAWVTLDAATLYEDATAALPSGAVATANDAEWLAIAQAVCHTPRIVVIVEGGIVQSVGVQGLPLDLGCVVIDHDNDWTVADLRTGLQRDSKALATLATSDRRRALAFAMLGQDEQELATSTRWAF